MRQEVIKTNPYEYALYGFSYILTIYVLVLTLSNIGYLRLLPALVALFAVCFLIAFLLKYSLMDLITSMHYRERMGLLFIYTMFFIVPLILFERPDFRLCLIFLALPLSLFLQRSSQFNRLYLLSALIFVLSLAKQPAMGWIFIEGFMLLLLGCFLFDYFYFKAERYETSHFLSITELAWLGLRIFLPLLTVGLGLHLLMPPMTPHPVSILSVEASRAQPAAATPVTTKTIISLAYHLIALIIIILLGLVILNWLRKKLARRHLAPIGRARAWFGKIEKFVEEKLARKWRTHLGDARSTIIFYYCLFCQELARLGYPRPVYQTPKEYNESLKSQIRPSEQELDYISHTFERARYGPETIAPQEAQEFKHLVHKVTDRIKESGQHQ